MKLFKTLFVSVLLLFSLQVAGSDIETVEDFSFKDIKGATHKFSDYRGKWVIVNYWGTYCAPCLEEIPDLVQFSERHKDKAVVLGLDAGGTPAQELIEFAEDNLMDYPIAPVQQSTLTAFGIISAIPTTYVVTPEGEVATRVIGIINLNVVEQFMQQYAKTEPKQPAPAAPAPKKERDSDSVFDL